MSKTLRALIATGMLLSGSACLAMDSGSDSESSESLPSAETMGNDFLVYIKNPSAARFVQTMDSMYGVDAWQRGTLKRSASVVRGQEFLHEHKYGTQLCQLLDTVEKELAATRTYVPMPEQEEGLYIRFQIPSAQSVRAVTKRLQKSPYIAKVVTDDIDGYIAQKRGGNPVHEKTLDKDNDFEICMEPVADDAVSADFLVYVGSGAAAVALKSRFAMFDDNARKVSLWRRRNAETGSLPFNEEWFRERSHFEQFFRADEKMTKRFGAQRSIVSMPDAEKGMYLKFHFDTAQNVNAVAHELKKAKYITKIVPSGIDAYLAQAREKLAAAQNSDNDNDTDKKSSSDNGSVRCAQQ